MVDRLDGLLFDSSKVWELLTPVTSKPNVLPAVVPPVTFALRKNCLVELSVIFLRVKYGSLLPNVVVSSETNFVSKMGSLESMTPFRFSSSTRISFRTSDGSVVPFSFTVKL